jgi:hypothetical protein
MGNNPMTSNKMFVRLEDLRLILLHLRSYVIDQVQDEDTSADLCDTIDHGITKIDRCMQSLTNEVKS